MSKRANPTLVGMFIVGAAALLIIGTIAFGSISFLKPRPLAVAYFPGNVFGLRAGAPVNLRGVQVGTVADIDVEIDAQAVTARIPVYMQFEPERVTAVGDTLHHFAGSGAGIRDAIRRGLTAQLALQSIVTGQLQVELDLLPRTGPEYEAGAKARIPEIPTVPSDIAQLKDVIRRLPLDSLMASLARSADSLDRLLSAPQMSELLRSVVEIARSTNTLVDSVNGEVKPISQEVTETLKTTRQTLAEAQKTFADARTTLGIADDVVRTDVRTVLGTAEQALQQATLTLSAANSLLAASSPQRRDIDQTLHNVALASQSLRLLSSELERRPNAILLGR